MGPDVRWVGTESGHGRETEWSVVPADNLDQAAIAAGSQQDLLFKPQGDMVGNDLGSRDRIRKARALIWYPAETDVSIRPGWFYHEAEDNKVKTPEQLLEIYFHSVGRNSVLLLNIPPDRRGQINAHDAESLLGWRKRLDEIFSTNLAKGAVVRSSGGLHPEFLVDGKYETAFTADPGDTTASLELNLAGTKTFNLLSLQENITAGQRIEKFTLQYWDGHAWQDAAAGTTVGYKRLLRFNPVSTNRVRLQILSSRLNPAISELALYDEK
jgi:alpha-L-fucosidase